MHDQHTTTPPTSRQASVARLVRRTPVVALALGLATVAGLALQATLLANPNRESRGCSLSTLRGRFLFADGGTVLPPAFGVTAPTWGADAGFHIFNGDGTGVDIVTVRIGNTVVLENFVTPITYTVNADCTGTYSVPDGPTFGLFISPDGDEFAAIATGPAGNYPAGIHPQVSHRR